MHATGGEGRDVSDNGGVTGHLVRAATVPVEDLVGAWEAAPAVIAAALVALALFFQGFRRLRRRGRADLASWGRAALFVLGVAVMTLALISPLDAIGEGYLLSAHMLQHVLIADVGPALILLGLSGPLLFFFLPRPALASVARTRWVRSALDFVTKPVVTFGLWCLVYAVWHVPSLYDYTLTHQLTHDLEHATFVLVGFLVWYQLIDPAGHGMRVSGRLAFIVALFAAGQILAMVLIFSLEPLYPVYAAQPERLLGLSPLTDQRLAGIVMMLDQVVMLGTLAAVLLLSADRERRGSPDEKPSLTAGRHL